MGRRRGTDGVCGYARSLCVCTRIADALMFILISLFHLSMCTYLYFDEVIPKYIRISIMYIHIIYKFIYIHTVFLFIASFHSIFEYI